MNYHLDNQFLIRLVLIRKMNIIEYKRSLLIFSHALTIFIFDFHSKIDETCLKTLLNYVFNLICADEFVSELKLIPALINLNHF